MKKTLNQHKIYIMKSFSSTLRVRKFY